MMMRTLERAIQILAVFLEISMWRSGSGRGEGAVESVKKKERQPEAGDD